MMTIVGIRFPVLLFLWLSVGTLAAQDRISDRYDGFFRDESRTTIEELLNAGLLRLENAQLQGDKVAEVNALNELGFIQLRLYGYGSAMDLFIEALAIGDSLALRDEKILTHLGIAQAYEDVGEYTRGAEFLVNALSLSTASEDEGFRSIILNRLGKISAAMGDDDEAHRHYQEALSYAQEIEDLKAESRTLSNIGNLLAAQGKHNDALNAHKKSLATRRRSGDRAMEAESLGEIGELYRMMKNSDRALANHAVSLGIRRSLGDRWSEAQSYNDIGTLYFELGNIERASRNFQLALQSAQESDNQRELQRGYEYMSACYEAAGDFKKALEYKDHSFAVQDMIQGDLNDRQLMKSQSRYDIGKKQSQIDKLQEEQVQREHEFELQKRFRNFLIVLVVLSLVIVALIFYFYRMQQRSNRVLQQAHEQLNERNLQLQELNATKDKFFSIISHDLKGPLNSLTSFSSLLINHTESLSREEIQMFAKDFDKSIKNLFALLENLLEWARSQTGNIEFTPEQFSLKDALSENAALLTTQAEAKNIQITYDSDENIVVNAHRNSVSTVIRNLISNAIKFTPEGGLVTLKLMRSGSDVMVSVSDTGVGMSQEVVDKLFRIDAKISTKGTANEKGTGLGLILCKEFIEKNGGRIWVKSSDGNGSVFYFLLPLVS
jgi:signal transduction histidine kinase